MIVVVADTSPLNYLVQINREHILPALYARVFVPPAVLEELNHPAAGSAVRRWLEPERLPGRLDPDRLGRPPNDARRPM